MIDEYEGYPLIDTGIIVTKTSDGLSDALHLECIYVEPGEDAHSVMRLRKTKDRYDFIRDKQGKIEGVKLIQVFECSGAAFSDAKVAVAAVAKMVERIERDRAERAGQLSLVLGELPDSDMSRTHHPDLAKNVDDALA